jgi:hypothetical protein
MNVDLTAISSSAAASGGKAVMGDDIKITGDVTGSAVGSSASFKGRDVSSYKSAVQSSSIENDTKAVLIRAKEQLEAEKLPPGEAEDASDDLAKLTAELEKPQKDAGRIAKLWEFLVRIRNCHRSGG